MIFSRLCVYEEYYSLKRNAVWFGRNLLTFRRSVHASNNRANKKADSLIRCLFDLILDTEDGGKNKKNLRNVVKVVLDYMAFIFQNIVPFIVIQDFI
jgi:hypothetical protein